MDVSLLLFDAIQEREPRFVEELVTYGADKDIRNNHGYTPKDYIEYIKNSNPDDENIKTIKDIFDVMEEVPQVVRLNSHHYLDAISKGMLTLDAGAQENSTH